MNKLNRKIELIKQSKTLRFLYTVCLVILAIVFLLIMMAVSGTYLLGNFTIHIMIAAAITLVDVMITKLIIRIERSADMQ